MINISVFCIWLPARLQISETFINLNNIWDRVEKALFLIIDCCLNIYFMYMVRTKLIANGLKKYELVYKFNLSMMVVSLLLDVGIIALMSWEDDAVYALPPPVSPNNQKANVFSSPTDTCKHTPSSTSLNSALK